MNRDRTSTFAFEAYSDIPRPKWAQLHRKEIHFYPSVSVRHTSLSLLTFFSFRPISKVFEKFPAEKRSNGRKIHYNLTNVFNALECSGFSGNKASFFRFDAIERKPQTPVHPEAIVRGHPHFQKRDSQTNRLMRRKKSAMRRNFSKML